MTKGEVGGEIVGWRRSGAKDTHILEIRVEGLQEQDIKDLEESTQPPYARVTMVTYEPEQPW